MAPAPPPQAVPAPAPGYAYPYRTAWWLPKLLCLVAAVCGVISAFEFSAILHGGLSMGWAWLAGAIAAYFLACAVP